MFLRHSFFSFGLFVCLAAPGAAQSIGNITIVPLMIDQSVPIPVIVTTKVPYRDNAFVQARVIQPIYAYDRQVIPPGAELEGHITGFRQAPAWTHVSAMLGGDFTPVQEPVIIFDTLVLLDGSRIPIATSVRSGAATVLRAGDKQEPNRDLKNSFQSTAKKPARQQFQSWLWSMSPYRPRYVEAGTPLTAELLEPLEFGVAVQGKHAFDQIGTEPPADSILAVRLITPLDSRILASGAQVEALVTRPLFSAGRQMLFPVGSKLSGTVTEVIPAKSFHRNGKLAFTFTMIVPPDSELFGALPQEVRAGIFSIELDKNLKDLSITPNGRARIVESKSRFLQPAWSFIKTDRAVNATSNSLGAIPRARIMPFGIGLGLYRAGRSFYSTFLGRGGDIRFPANTLLELRLEKPVKP